MITFNNRKPQREGLRQRVINDSFWNIFATVMSRGGGLIFTIILTRALLPESFGVYSLAMSVALMFLTFADLGINQTMIRFVSSEINKDKKKAAAYFRYILKLKLILAFSILIVLILIAYPLAYFIFKKPEVFMPLLFLSFYTFILAIEGFFESLFYINNKVKYVAFKEVGFQILRVLFLLLIFTLIAESYYIFGAIVSLIVSLLVATIFIIYFSRKSFSSLFQHSEEDIDKKRIIRFVSYLTIGGLSGIFFAYADTLILGIFVSSEYIGYYKAAANFIFGIAGMFSFVNVFLPVLTKVEDRKLSITFDKIMKYSMIISIPAMFGLISLSSYVLVAIYGYEYIYATLPLYFLSPMIVLAMWLGNIQVLFSAREKPREFAKLTMVMTISNVLLNVLFVYFLLKYSELWAIAGAAAATLICWIVYVSAAIVLTKRKLGIKLSLKPIIKPVIASIFMITFLWGYKQFAGDMNLVKGAIEVVFGMLIYFTALFLIGGLDKEEICQFKMGIRKILSPSNYTYFAK